MSEQSDIDGKIYTVQYFERALFEAHPENSAPYDVLLALLGVSLYKEKYPSGAPEQVPNNESGSRLFPETGKRVAGAFLTYWESHGSLTQQGLPISDEFIETSALDGNPYKVQYFERAVFEYHPENAGSPYEVLLSQIGTFRWKEKQAAPVPTAVPITNPTSVVGNTPVPTQNPGPNPDELAQGAVQVYGPVSGSLPHNGEDKYISDRTVDAGLRNFMIKARFYNPYAPSRHAWDYGFLFRQKQDAAGSYSQYRVALTSSGEWSLTLGLGDGPYGHVSNADLSGTGSNELKVIAKNENGWLFVNDQFVTNLYLRDNLNFGKISIGTGLINGDELTGETTNFTNFTIWSLP
jgi:hypothetical protein